MGNVEELKSELAEVNAQKTERADKLRFKFLALSDDDLIWFAHAVNSGDDIKCEPFEDVNEFVVRVARQCKESIPF